MTQKTLFIIASILLCIAACVNFATNTTNPDLIQKQVPTLLHVEWFETKYLYMIVHALVYLPIIALSFDKKVFFIRTYRIVLPAIVSTGILFIIWDFAKTHMHVWGFNPYYVIGMYLWNLPLEELLFFITVPTACMFMYVCFVAYGWMPRGNTIDKITVYIILALSVLGFACWDYTYTSTVSLLAAATVSIHVALGNAYTRTKTYVLYAVSLIPFILVNGILTGAFQSEPVVWYNTGEFLNIRIISIPIEDAIYLLPLLLINTSLYEWFRQKFGQKTDA
ncbi:MAG TPA: lycopene cyclase domain-containing protein [Bacteroidales bacterium]|nr:lycopene cyclase domain-containing protein [Bacteroidales bacterium]